MIHLSNPIRAFSLSSLLVIASTAAYAQTNTFPATGRAGIGTTQPLEQLDIRGGSILLKNLDNTDNESVIMIGQSLSFGNYSTLGTSLRSFTESAGSNRYALQFFTQESHVTGQTEKMRIAGNGNISIGTASLQEKLTVGGNIAVLDGSGYHVVSSNGLNWASTKLITRNWDGIDFTEISVPGHSANQAKIRLNANGNVGIGTSAPPEKLSVNGKILVTEIKVATVANWPDYVFSRDYIKMTLRETESFIRKYGHLPEIPNAASVEKDGIQLAEMNKLLLKKIEELTLHLIEKDHQMEQMEKTNNAKFRQLQEEINLLKHKN